MLEVVVVLEVIISETLNNFSLDCVKLYAVQ